MKRRTNDDDNRGIFSKLMSEPIRMPGFPSIIVTRGFCYQWLKGCGWNGCERGFGSLDYMVFAPAKSTEDLTIDALRDSLLTQVRDGYIRTGNGRAAQ